jgi:hypothetical protein
VTEEEYFARFAAALFAAYRTDAHKTDVARDVERALGEAKVAAAAAFDMKDYVGEAALQRLKVWREALKGGAI